MTTKNWIQNLKIDLKNSIIKFPFPKFQRIQNQIQFTMKKIFYLDTKENPFEIKDEKDYKYFIDKNNNDWLILMEEEEFYKLLGNTNNTNRRRASSNQSYLSTAFNTNSNINLQKLNISQNEVNNQNQKLSFKRELFEDITIIDYEQFSNKSDIYCLQYEIVNNSCITYPKGCYVKFLEEISSISLTIDDTIINPNEEIFPNQSLSFQIKIKFNYNMKFPNKIYLLCFAIFTPFSKEQISSIYYQKIITKAKEEPLYKKMNEIDQNFQLSESINYSHEIEHSSNGYINANGSSLLRVPDEQIVKKNEKQIEYSINDNNQLSDTIIESIYLQLEKQYSLSTCFNKEFILKIIKDKKGDTSLIERELGVRIM